MASVETSNPVAPQIATPVEPFQDTKRERHNVKAILNYHKEAEDGSPPAPTYVE